MVQQVLAAARDASDITETVVEDNKTVMAADNVCVNKFHEKIDLEVGSPDAATKLLSQ